MLANSPKDIPTTHHWAIIIKSSGNIYYHYFDKIAAWSEDIRKYQLTSSMNGQWVAIEVRGVAEVTTEISITFNDEEGDTWAK